MESLNDIVRNYVESRSSFSKLGELEVDFDFDPDMPSIYPNSTSDDGTPEYLSKLLSELTGEQLDAQLFDRNLTKLRYSTLFVDGVQVIIIENNGEIIPDDTISRLNKELERIGSGGYRQGRLTGSVRAALQARAGGGRIYIENHPESEYKVETTVEIPVKSN